MFTLFLLGWVCAQPSPVPFTTIARGDQSQIDEARTVVARTAAEWTALWKAHDVDAPAPKVDLKDSMVVAVFTGYRPSAGHSVEITRIEKQGGELVVTYRVQAPKPDEMVAQVLTFPFHIVRTAAYGGPVRFERER